MSFVGISSSQLVPVTAAISGALAAIATQVAVAEAVLDETVPATFYSGPVIGGVLPGVNGALSAATFTRYVTVANQEQLLLQLAARLTRMGINAAQGSV